MDSRILDTLQRIIVAASLFAVASATPASGDASPPNILLITADDLNADSLGVYDCPVPGTTPSLDALAAQSLRFERAHVNIAVCQPLRSVIMTGKYPHRSGGEGFHKLHEPGQAILPQLLREGGFQVGILGKVNHSTPYADDPWDLTIDQPDLGWGRDPDAYARAAKRFFKQAQKAEKPFFLMANSHDPHRPFSNADQEVKWRHQGRTLVRPSKPFWPSEIEVPGFLLDLPEIRREVAEYYSSVRRADDIVGALLHALESSGAASNTLVIFLSDHGMALPFAKTNVYRHSTRTPLIIRWPGVTEAGHIDSDHFVSTIDFLPTLLEAVGIDEPEGIDGRSFLPLLKGETQEDRDRVFTQFHETSAKRRYPMRAVITADGGYIFNAWAGQEDHPFKNESQSGRTFKAMQNAAQRDPDIAQRVRHFLYRTPEELYDYAKDPDALRNLADDHEHGNTLFSLRRMLLQWMIRTDDPLLADFRAFLKRERPPSPD